MLKPKYLAWPTAVFKRKENQPGGKQNDRARDGPANQNTSQSQGDCKVW